MSVPVPSTPTNPADELVAVVEDLVERQRQILGALVVTTHPLKNDVQAVLLGLRGVVTKLRNGAADTPTPDDSHGVRRLIVHPATWDGLVRFLDVRGIEVTPYPDEDGIPTFGMGIKWLPLPSSVQGDTTPGEVDLLRQAAKAAREHGNELRADMFEMAATDHEGDDCSKGERAECMAVELARKALAEYATSTPSEGDHHAAEVSDRG